MSPDDARHELRQQRAQTQRLTILATSSASYTLDSLWLLLLASQRVIPYSIPLTYFLLAMLASSSFLLLHLSKRNLRFTDPDMTLIQVITGYSLQLLFLFLAPQAAPLFFITIFVVSAFSVLTMSVRANTLSGTIVASLLGILFILKADQFQFPVNTTIEKLCIFGSFVSAWGRFIFLSSWTNQLRQKLHYKNSQLKESLERIEQLASTDELTQTMNRRSFMKLAEYEFQRSHRSQKEFSLLLLDLDRFKTINDSYGHMTGDEVLKVFSQLIKETIRITDSLGRYGGEEFVLLLPETSGTGAIILAERIRLRLSHYDWTSIAPDLAVTVSVGVATYVQGEDLKDMIARADQALYKAKKQGRNQSVKAEPPNNLDERRDIVLSHN
ncbi:MAG: GGDEF domain-containing protein [Trueperaceae bacterium]|nr:GGDEF domain-containing protein [Trueperaceae bacterium]